MSLRDMTNEDKSPSLKEIVCCMGMIYFEGYSPVLFRELIASYSHANIESHDIDAEKDTIRKTRQEMFAIGYNWPYVRNISYVGKDDSKDYFDESKK